MRAPPLQALLNQGGPPVLSDGRFPWTRSFMIFMEPKGLRVLSRRSPVARVDALSVSHRFSRLPQDTSRGGRYRFRHELPTRPPRRLRRRGDLSRDAQASRPSPFLWTQFLGAFNDNLFKIVVSMLAVHPVPASGGGEAAAVGSSARLSSRRRRSCSSPGYAGQLADIHSKRTAPHRHPSRFQIVAMALGLVAFSLGHLQLTYVVLFLMATHSTFFSPCEFASALRKCCPIAICRASTAC